MKLEQLQEMIEVPRAVREFEPEWGIVLGSGLGNVVDEVDAILHLPYEEVRVGGYQFPQSGDLKSKAGSGIPAEQSALGNKPFGNHAGGI